MLHQYAIQALVVDDFSAMRSMLRGQLLAIGVQHVKEAAHAAGALDKLREGAFNLCIIDYNLGDATDGQQLLDYIRTERLLPSSAVCCFVTGDSRYEAVAKVAEHSPDTYLIKPFSADRLGTTLRQVFVRKHGSRHYQKKSPGLRPLYDQFDAGNYKAVIALVDVLTSKEGIKPDSARLKGEALLAQGDIAEALAHYETLADQFAWAALGVAKAKTVLHDTRQAIQVLEKLVAEAPLYIRATDLLAEAYIRDSRKEMALPILEAACEKSPTVARLRLTAQVAELLGLASVAAQWSEKTVHANKHALVKQPLDYARHIRNLVKAGFAEKALSTLVAYENEWPGLKADKAMMAVRAIAMTAYLEQETERFNALSDALRVRRLAALQEFRDRRDGLLNELRDQSGDDQAAVYVAEAMITGGDSSGCEIAARAAACGAFLPNDLPLRSSAISHLLDHYEAQTLEGLEMIRRGHFREAFRHCARLSEQVPREMAPQVLATVILSVVSLHRQEADIVEELPMAKAAYQRLKRQYPDHERLISIESEFLSILR